MFCLFKLIIFLSLFSDLRILCFQEMINTFNLYSILAEVLGVARGKKNLKKKILDLF